MLTTLSIFSLDQGKIWKDPCPLPREEAVAAGVEDTPVAPEGSRTLSALLAYLAGLTLFAVVTAWT